MENNHCYTKHPPLEIKIGNKDFLIQGGSCHEPILKNANIYISLDTQASIFEWEQPWHENHSNQKHVRFHIEDMSVPSKSEEFIACINYTLSQLVHDKKIHVGCTAGHGRTGLFLAALVQTAMGNNLANISAIDYVRDKYCTKAVETVPQILYLEHIFGVKVPRKHHDEIREFKEIFKDLVGMNLENALKSHKIDDLVDFLSEADSILFSKQQNRPILNKDYFLETKIKIK